MTENSYHIAWLIYILACTGFCFVFWQLLKSRLPLHQYSFITLTLILLLTPYFSDPAQSRLAPALLTTLFEGIFGDQQLAIKAMIPIAALFIPAALVITLLEWRRIHRKQSETVQ